MAAYKGSLAILMRTAFVYDGVPEAPHCTFNLNQVVSYIGGVIKFIVLEPVPPLTGVNKVPSEDFSQVYIIPPAIVVPVVDMGISLPAQVSVTAGILTVPALSVPEQGGATNTLSMPMSLLLDARYLMAWKRIMVLGALDGIVTAFFLQEPTAVLFIVVSKPARKVQESPSSVDISTFKESPAVKPAT
jgi:hypothetical protein